MIFTCVFVGPGKTLDRIECADLAPLSRKREQKDKGALAMPPPIAGEMGNG